MNKVVNYGIVGFGRYGKRRLQPAFQKSTTSRLFGITRRDARDAEASARQFNIPFFTNDPEELVSHPDVDAVLVSSPPSFHRDHVLLAARYNKHVLVEKPIASNAGEVRDMIRRCSESGVKLMSGFVMRFIDTIQQTRELVEKGEIGKIRYAGGHFGLDVSTFPREWLEDPVVSAGGPVADLGSHLLDLMDFILNRPVVAVKSILKPTYSKKSIERGAAVVLEWENDILGTLFVTFDAIRESGLTFHGTKGKLTLTDFNQPEMMTEINWLSEKGRRNIRIYNQNHYTRMLDHFAEAIIFDKTVLTPGETGLRNQLLLDRIYGRE